MSIQKKMLQELSEKTIFNQARKFAFQYSDQIPEMRVFPSEKSISDLSNFDEPMPQKSSEAIDVLERLHVLGGPATIAQTGGRYFGFVDGGAVPVSIAAKWLTDFWDQCGGLYLTSPVNARLESVCERWLKELFGLPDETVAGFVSGTSMANLSGLAAARYRLLMNQGWDVNEKGLNGAPKIRIIAHREVHSSVKKTLTLLGFGTANMEWIASDEHGRLDINALPQLDNTCLVLTQAGNVNSGAFDPFEQVCSRANNAGAWVHVDGAFGLWAQACASLKYLTKGMEKAHSWAVDGHKTLNTPYDSGVVLCRDKPALVSALQASADYLIYTDHREPLHYGPEMSKRSRALELWSVMKYLGASGIDQMITGFHTHAKNIGAKLASHGFEVLNDITFNQVIVAYKEDDSTKKVLTHVQNSGECWVGGSMWHQRSVIRISICSWATTTADIDRSVAAFVAAKESIES